MSHEMSGYNKEGEEIAYARFSMGNYNATILYDLLDANKFNAGVSGSGDSATYSIQQLEKAKNAYNQSYNITILSNIDNLPWDQKQILTFLSNCFTTAQKEGSVSVSFS